MALGVLDVLGAVAGHREMLVVGVNAIPEAIAAIEAGRMLATANFDAMTMSGIATEAAVRHLRGEASSARDHSSGASRRRHELFGVEPAVRRARVPKLGRGDQPAAAQVYVRPFGSGGHAGVRRERSTSNAIGAGLITFPKPVSTLRSAL